MAKVRCQDYIIEPVYQNLTKSVRNEIIVFWLENGALQDIHEAKRRVDEVVLTARNPNCELVGISTVYAGSFGDDDATYLCYRMFIRSHDRVPGLMQQITQGTRYFFNANPSLQGKACGMILCTENPKLMRPGMKRLFERSVWDYQGTDSRGLDVWRYLFTS